MSDQATTHGPITLAGMSDEELGELFIERSRAGQSVEPINAEKLRRRRREEAFEVARAGNAIAKLARLSVDMLTDEDCDQADERYTGNHFRGAILTAIELLADRVVIANAETLEDYIGADVVPRGGVR